MNKVGRIALVVNALLVLSVYAQQQPGPRRLDNPAAIHLQGGSVVDFVSFESESIQKNAQFSVFLPPSYQKDPQRRFPVVYFLHGLWNDHTSWAVERYGGIPGQVEELMLNGSIPECLLVHPDGENSFYADFLDGSRKYEQLVAHEIPEYVEGHYRVLGDRDHRALGGVSMGGYGALKVALKHPGRYASVAAVSPIILTGDDPSVLFDRVGGRMGQYLSRALQPVFGIPFDREHWKQNNVEELAKSADVDGLAILFAYGTADRYNEAFPIEKGIVEVDQTLTARGIAHTFKRYENGPHGWQLVGDHLEEIARFLCRSF